MALILANANPRAVWGQLVPRESCFVVGLTFWLRNQEASSDEIGWLLQDVFDDLYGRISRFHQLQVGPNSGLQLRCEDERTTDGLKSITYHLYCQRCPKSDRRMASSIFTSVWEELMEVVEVIRSLARERETNDPGINRWAEPQPAHEMRPFSDTQGDLARKFDRYFVAMRVFHPDPTTNLERSMLRCAVAHFDRPPPAKRFTRTRLYHGPVIAIDKVTEMLQGFTPAIRGMPDSGPDWLRRMRQAIPEQGIPRFNDKLLGELDRKDSKELVKEFFPETRRWMETCIAALQTIAYSRRPLSNMDICSAIHAVLTLRRSAPPFTFSVRLLEDAKFQRVALRATTVGTVVIGAALIYATGGLAAGSIAAAAATSGTSAAVAGAASGAASAAAGAVTAGAATAGAATAGAATAGAATAGTVTAGAGSTAVLAGGTALLGAGAGWTYKSVMAHAEMAKVRVINDEIDMILRKASYYLALSFLTACGVEDSIHSSLLQEVLSQLGASMPALAFKENVPAFLKNLIDKLWTEFDQVQKVLKKAECQLDWMQRPRIAV